MSERNPRSANMRAIRRRDTSPEMRLRRLLHSMGFRYFVDRRALPDLRWKADLVFPSKRVAVFVDGCYWHGCPEHFKPPKVNAEYWGPKIARNRERDGLFDEALRIAGWKVVRAWEHEPVEEVAARVAAAVDD